VSCQKEGRYEYSLTVRGWVTASHFHIWTEARWNLTTISVLAWRSIRKRVKIFHILWIFIVSTDDINFAIWWCCHFLRTWSVGDGWMNECYHLWNDTNRRKLKCWEEKLSQCHFVHHESHMDTWENAGRNFIKLFPPITLMMNVKTLPLQSLIFIMFAVSCHR